ncbi:transcriptional regulator [Occultella aeris]|uniref:YheO-like PAS domain protein n=1 Tax=Occultella aeris TaxID=2761496 RepID=A0A7M4DSJ5_9MICO|nr:PAS domain-containing protein [Occultella aeris]VZO40439.1 YheO-like PAS domain protein [Occultella aeris]
MTEKKPQPAARSATPGRARATKVTALPAKTRATRPAREQATDELPPCDRDWLIALFKGLVEPLGRALPISAEVVLHDLALLPNSIVAVHGDVTGRQVGDPATDLLLERATTGELDHMMGYASKLPDGRQLRSTTMIIRDAANLPVAALCINSDLSMWHSVERIAAAMVGGVVPAAESPVSVPQPPQVPVPEDTPSEVFARDVDELASHLVHQAVTEQGIPVELMKKEHKIAVVRALKARGMFLLRDAVEMIAATLMVTRFTIYNYLNEIEDEDKDGPPSKQGTTKRKG